MANGTVVLDEETFNLGRNSRFPSSESREVRLFLTSLISIEQDLEVTATELKNEGMAREKSYIEFNWQGKNWISNVTDRIRVTYQATPKILPIVKQFREYIEGEVLAVDFTLGDETRFRLDLNEESFEFGLEQVPK